MIDVIVADDHAAIRSGIATILGTADGIRVVGEAADGDAAIALVRSTEPDVVLMDIRMPGVDGIDATSRIVAAHDTRVLILTTFDVDDLVFRALRAGASGFLLKSVSADDLVDAVRSVAAGDGVLAPTVTRTLIDAFASGSRPPADTPAELADLTDRERDVLRALGSGQSNAEIARTLFIGETTVKTHVSRILTKLNLSSRVQAAILAKEAGLATHPAAANTPDSSGR